MHTFAKLFQVNNHQVLYLKEYDTDENENELFKIVGKTEHNYVQLSITFTFENEEAQLNYFSNLNQEIADNFFIQLSKTGINIFDDNEYEKLIE